MTTMGEQRSTLDAESLMLLITNRWNDLGRPVVVGLSGYAGSDTSALMESPARIVATHRTGRIR